MIYPKLKSGEWEAYFDSRLQENPADYDLQHETDNYFYNLHQSNYVHDILETSVHPIHYLVELVGDEYYNSTLLTDEEVLLMTTKLGDVL